MEMEVILVGPSMYYIIKELDILLMALGLDLIMIRKELLIYGGTITPKQILLIPDQEYIDVGLRNIYYKNV
jgi:hypothetical protein